MSDSAPGDKIDFSLSKSAQEYLSGILPNWTQQMSERGFVPMLSYSGSETATCKKSGKVTWEFRGALFLLAGHRPEALRDGGYFDLAGFRVWIGNMDQRLLSGRVLTFVEVGAPEPKRRLVIENAPENFFRTVFKENTACSLRQKPVQ